MKRRDFIKRVAPIPMLPFVMNGFPVQAYGRNPWLEAITAAAIETDHVLVLVQLNGGNDGLNTVIPIDQYSLYMNARTNIAIPESSVLKFNDETGLHPAMTGMKALYDDGRMVVVQSVGYPNQNFSHFRSTDIWLTASDSNVVLTSGWAGRYLQSEFPDYPTGYPNAVMPDPLAIQIGSVVSTALMGSTGNMGIAISNPTTFYNIVTGTVEPAPNTRAGHELTYVRTVIQQTQAFADALKAGAANGSNLSTKYPATGNSLASQLKIVAQLISGGLKTRIYIVNLGGFDTHNAQVVSGDTTTGNHATLLNRVSVAIEAFQDDLKLLGVEDRVIGMTFSEFGRRIKSNGSFGTDHGSAAPLFVFGSKVNPGIIGANVQVPANPATNSNIPMQYDFRSIYATMLKDWFGVSEGTLQQILFKDFQILPIIKSGTTSTRTPFSPAGIALHQNYPNPFNPSTAIPFTSNGSRIRISVFDDLGREVRTVADGYFPEGNHTLHFNGEGLASGTYYYRMQSGSFQNVKAMMLAK